MLLLHRSEMLEMLDFLLKLFSQVKSFIFRPTIIRLKIRRGKSRLEYTLYKHATDLCQSNITPFIIMISKE